MHSGSTPVLRECTPGVKGYSRSALPECRCTPGVHSGVHQSALPEESIGSPWGVHRESMGGQKESISIRAENCRVGAGYNTYNDTNDIQCDTLSHDINFGENYEKVSGLI